MKNYHDLVKRVLKEGVQRTDRTGTGTRSIFSPDKLRFDLSKGFPLLTTKKIFFDKVVSELLWFLRGESSIKFLHQHKNKIWDEWADDKQDVGRIYGVQWRKCYEHFGKKIDQIQLLIQGLKSDPQSRRHLVSAWNVADLKEMNLPPCHFAFQCYVHEGKLSLTFMMRSADLFLGVPFNIASYGILTHLLARATGLEVGELVLNITGDAHIYNNHTEQVETMLKRRHRKQPTLQINTDNLLIDGYLVADFKVLDYNAHGFLKAPVSV